jgi:CorA-like Mg2+ transporter protein
MSSNFISQTNEEAETFFYLKTKFQQLSKTNKARDRNENLRALLDELLDITDEVDMLNEVKDIHDELYMISQVFDQQLNVLNQMGDLLEYRPADSLDPEVPVTPHVIKKWKKLQIEIEQRRDRLAEMDANAHRTYKNINNLFDMKQRQANVLEAHYSRKVAQDSGRQSTTIMVFTIVTIVFLPLSFMSSFFAISVKEFPRDGNNALYMSLSYVSTRVFGIGISIAAAIVLLAFGINEWASPVAGSGFLFRRRRTSTAQEQASTVAPSSASISFSTGASHKSALTSLRRRGTAMLRAPDGRRFTLKPKRIVAERQDGVSLFSYNSIIRHGNGGQGGSGISTTAKRRIIEEKEESGGGSSPSTQRSWWSSPWRSSPVLASQNRDAELERALERNVGSWDVGVAGNRKRRWASWRARMMGNEGRVSTV